MKRSPVRVGIAGLGRSGWTIHALSLEKLTKLFKIAAVFDQDRSRLAEAHARFGCAAYEAFDGLVGSPEVDLVVVAMPNRMHAEYSIKALKAGKNVLCEKPMATTLRDADRMVRTAKRTGKLLTVFQNRRYAPDYLKVREVMASGRLGRITHVRLCTHAFERRWDWQTLRKCGGGSLNNMGSHYLDVALQILGDREPDEIFCHLDRTTTLGDADDHVKVVMKAKGAPVVEVELFSDAAYAQPHWFITATRGGLMGTASELRWKWIIARRLKKRIVDERPPLDRSYDSEDLPWSKERVWQVKAGSALRQPRNTHLSGQPRQHKPQSRSDDQARRDVYRQLALHRRPPRVRTRRR